MATVKNTYLLIVGSGPYGLAAAAYAKHKGLDFLILGRPMEFWKLHMPKGMFLRSGPHWHLDPLNVYTFLAFLESKGLNEKQADPISLELYQEYGQWFVDRIGLEFGSALVRELNHHESGYEAILNDGSRILAEKVLVAPGFRHFTNIPESLTATIPDDRYAHTCELVELERLRDQRCLILGGRQSAFESAALISEMGGRKIHLVYRHDTPRFEPSDWSWVDAMMDLTANVPGWYRRLPAEERSAIEQRFWAEGRLKLEPWLAPRIGKENIKLWPHCSLQGCQVANDKSMLLQLSNGQRIAVDYVLLATGYRVNVGAVPFLSRENIVSALQIHDGFPVLDESFQTSIPGLYMTGLVATKDFGPFYGFVRGCPTAARIIVDHIVASRRD